MIAAPVFGWLAGRWSRWRLVALGIALWSLASGASGLAMTFGVLLATRCLVGVGEAAYGPVAPTIIADYFPLARRGQALSWFYIAIPVGGALGYVLGGYMAGINHSGQSWRWAFYAVVIPGLLLGLSSFARVERGAASFRRDNPAASPYRTTCAGWQVCLTIMKTPSYTMNTLGMTAMTFAMGAYAWWMPAYLLWHRVGPLWGIEPRAMFGAMTAAAGVLGTLAGGIVGDASPHPLARIVFSRLRGRAARLRSSARSPFLVVPFPAAWLFIFLAEFFLFFNTGPTNTILANVVHPASRSAGFGLNILIIHLFGDAISPTAVGAIADRFNLATGFVVVSGFLFLGGVFWLWGARHWKPTHAAAMR